MVVEYQKSLMSFLICQLSSILSIFLNQEFSFCIQMEHSFDFWFLVKIHWLQTTKTSSMSSKKERVCGVFVGVEVRGWWCVIFLWPSTSFCLALLLMHCSGWEHTFSFQCVALPGKGCTRWWQWRLIRQGYTGCGFSAEPRQFFPPFGTKQHLLRAALLASVVNPDEFLSHQNGCFTTAKLMIFRKNQIYNVKT